MQEERQGIVSCDSNTRMLVSLFDSVSIFLVRVAIIKNIKELRNIPVLMSFIYIFKHLKYGKEKSISKNCFKIKFLSEHHVDSIKQIKKKSVVYTLN